MRNSRQISLSAQGSLIHGTFGRPVLTGSAALHPDERAAEPHRGQNVFTTQRPSAASTSYACTGRNQTSLCDQVGNGSFSAAHSCLFEFHIFVHIDQLVVLAILSLFGGKLGCFALLRQSKRKGSQKKEWLENGSFMNQS